MALPENLIMRVNLDPLRADPSVIQDYEASIQAILDTADGSKLVDIDTLRAYDKALKGIDLEETFDTFKEIQTSIKNEINRATESENSLSQALANEEARAIAAETGLNTNLTEEISRATVAEETLTNNLNLEIDRAIKADNKLNTGLAEEQARAKLAEEKLTTDLANEIKRAQEIEANLQDVLDTKAVKDTVNQQFDVINTKLGAIPDNKNVVALIDDAKSQASTELKQYQDKNDARVKVVEDKVDALSSATHFLGVKNELTDVSDPAAGDIVIVGNKEYIYDANKQEWIELGDTTAELLRITSIEINLSAEGDTGKAIAAAQQDATAALNQIDAINHTTTGILATANKYTDTEVAKDRERLALLEAIEHDAYIDADTDLEKKLNSAIADALQEAKNYADEHDADTIYDDTEIKASIQENINALADEKEARIGADEAINAAIEKLNEAIENLPDISPGTTYTFASTENPLEFTATPSVGEVQTITLVAPDSDGDDINFETATNNEINSLWKNTLVLGDITIKLRGLVLDIDGMSESSTTPSHADIYINNVKVLTAPWNLIANGIDISSYLTINAQHIIYMVARRGLLESYSNGITYTYALSIETYWSKYSADDPDDSIMIRLTGDIIPSDYQLSHYRDGICIKTISIPYTSREQYITCRGYDIDVETNDVIQITAVLNTNEHEQYYSEPIAVVY